MNTVAATQSQGALLPLKLNAAIIRQFVTISPHATVAEAIAQLSALEETNAWASASQPRVTSPETVPVRCLVTVEEGRVLGLCTDRDLVTLGAQNPEVEQLLLAHVAAPVPVTLRESECTDFATVAKLFKQYNTAFIPVIDDQNQLSGLLTYQSLLTLARPTSLMEFQGVNQAMISDFICAEPSTSIRAIAQLMTTHNATFAIVLAPSAPGNSCRVPLGWVTERDVVQVALERNLNTTMAAEVMHTPLQTVAPDTSAHRAYQLMREGSTPCLGVIGTEGALLGIVTRASLLQILDPEALFAIAESLEQRIMQLETEQQAYGSANQGNPQQAPRPQPSLPLVMSQQEQFLAALTNASPVGIFHTNPDGQCDFVNERWCEIAGLTPAMANGWGWTQALHPDDRDRVAVEWARSVAEARPFQLEYRFRNAQGQITWVQGQAIAEWDAEGEIVGYVGTITDISAQRLTQEKLEFQIELDRLVANISSRFIQLSSTSTTNDINLALQEIGEFTQVDSSYIFQFSDLENVHSMTHEWVAPGISSNLQNTQNLPFSLFPWATARLQNGESVHIADSALLPPEAAIDQQTLHHFGIQSALNIPLIAQGNVKGFVGFVTFREPRHWSADNIRLLQIFADILMHVLQRQQTEVELQRSKQQYVSLAESVPVGLFRTDIAGNCIYINSYWCHLSGLDTQSSLGLGWAQAIHPEDRDRVITQWQQCVQTQTIFQQEYRLQHTDGHIVWVYAQAVVEYNHQGQISGYIGTLTDISTAKQSEAERKIVELALRQQEETLQLFAKHAPVGIAMLDSNFCYIYASQRWIDNYNLHSIETLKGRSHYEIFPEVPERWRHIHQRCLNGAIERCEEDLFERADGTKQWIRWEIRPWYQSNRSIGGIIIFSEDISERKQAQRSLQASEERLRLALAAANQGLYDLNLKTGEAIVNSEYATMLGYDPTTFQETHENWIARMHPEDREQVAPVYHNYIAGVVPNYKVEFRQRTSTGEWKWILSLGKIVEWDEHNQPLRMLGTHTDISDRKQAELRLKEANRKITNIWESMIDAYITMDRDWRIIYANPTATQIISNLTQLEPEEFLGKTHWELFPMFVGQDLEREYHRAIDEQVAIHLEVQYEPTEQWFEMYAYPSREGLGVYFRDISDRIRAEAERQEAEQTRSELKLLENILDVILAGYWDWNIPEDQEYCSSGFLRLLGYADNELPNHSQTWKDLIFAEDLPIILDSRERHIRSGGATPCYSEVRYRHRNGSTIWVMCSGQVIEWDDTGHPIRMIGCHIDITARKQAEAELFRSQQLREAIFNELSDALFLVDPDTRQILDCNWRAVELFEAPAREALIGLQGNNLRRQQSAETELTNIAAEVQSKGVWSREVEYLTLKGNPFWGNIAAKPIIVADHTLNLVRVTDISDRKRVESQLRNLSDRLALAVTSGAIGIWDWNIPENTLEWDDRMLEMYGIARDQFGSVYEAWTTCLHPEDRDATEAAIQQALSGQKDYDLQFRIIRPDGNIRFIQASALVQRNSQGEPQRMAGINYDITERKQAEFTIQKTAAQLAATNRELESFSYSVSHDLRAPLRHMSGFVSALQQQLDQQGALDNPKVVHYLNVIHNSSKKMGQLIDGLLSLSRMGRRPMNWQQVSIQELVEEAIALTQLEGTETSPPVEFSIGNLPVVMGDATLLQQVFRNLIENAIKFSRNSPNPHIEINSTADGTIWVKDNGAGFQMEYADKLFGAFQRLHSQSEFEGLGIGLAIVQRIVQRHGGTIWAKAKLNEGATFYVNFTNQVDMSPLSS